MGLAAVGDLALDIIFSKLEAIDAARAACVNKKLRASASEDSLWSHLCARDLDLSQPLDPNGNLAPSFKASYQLWREAFNMYPWSLVQRVKRCWDKLRNWLTINFPEAVSTLNKGATEADIQQLENILKVKLPLPMRILYRFQDGQDLVEDHLQNSLVGCPLGGLIGGYSFYNHLVTVSFLPLNLAIVKTKPIAHKLGFSGRSNFVVVAGSRTYSEKLFLLNCTNGQLYVGTANLLFDGEMLACVPNALISSVHEQQDAILLWLEEHGRRLENGIIKLRQEGNFRIISQFPDESPLCSTAITNGVKIRASAVFVPEDPRIVHTSKQYSFAYSIRMSLLPEGCVINGMKFSSCQLSRRHWIIRADDVVVADVYGEGVIGQYPHLYPGDDEFVYESCTPIPSSSGSIEGSFTFVPGSLREPKGAPFEVAVGRFPLQLPDYIF